MSANCALAVLAILLGSATLLQAGPVGTFRTVDDIVAEQEKSCAGVDMCRTARDLTDGLSALQASFTPNTMVHRGRYDPEARLNTALQKAIFQHPQRFGAYCAGLHDIATRSAGREAAFATLTLAARLQVRRAGCVAPVVAALPATPDARDALAAFKETCAVDPRLSCGLGPPGRS